MGCVYIDTSLTILQGEVITYNFKIFLYLGRIDDLFSSKIEKMQKKIVDPTMDPAGIFLKLYVITSPQAGARRARVSVNATHKKKVCLRVERVHLTL
jgi:hypothetical protein